MGGVFGFVCRDKVRGDILYEGLRRLMYRGIDGCGIAFVQESGQIIVRKKAMSIDKVRDLFGFDEILTASAIGHVWHAIRGAPVDENTQPHKDCYGRVFTATDGLISNYEDIKRALRNRGHILKSTTDVEILPHLMEEKLRSGLDILEALRIIGNEAKGMYTAIFMIEGVSQLGFIAREQHIVIGMSNKCVFVSSDIPSLYGLADEAVIIEEDSAGIVSINGFKAINIETGDELRVFTRKTLKRIIEYPEKGEYPHFMLKEIYEIPEALKRTTLSLMEKYLRLAAMITANARNILIIGSGSSYHAALVSQYYFSRLAQLSASVVNASEFPFLALDSVTTGTLVIAISQSGETSDVIRSVKLAKTRGAVVIGVTNTLGSRLTMHSNVYLPIGAGPELAVPATKTFVSTLASLLILSAYIGLYRGVLNESDVRNIYRDIEGMAENIRRDLRAIDEEAERLSHTLRDKHVVYVVGSGILYPIALEGVLKLKEASLIHAIGLQLGELRHGHIAVISRGVPVILLEPIEEDAMELFTKISEMLQDRGALTIKISRNGDVRTPDYTEYTAPIAYVIPLQLLAYKLGVLRGTPIDTPPGLAKAITA